MQHAGFLCLWMGKSWRLETLWAPEMAWERSTPNIQSCIPISKGRVEIGYSSPKQVLALSTAVTFHKQTFRMTLNLLYRIEIPLPPSSVDQLNSSLTCFLVLYDLEFLFCYFILISLLDKSFLPSLLTSSEALKESFSRMPSVLYTGL